MLGPGLVSKDDRTLESSAPGRSLRLDVVALTTPSAASPKIWQSGLARLVAQLNAISIDTARTASGALAAPSRCMSVRSASIADRPDDGPTAHHWEQEQAERLSKGFLLEQCRGLGLHCATAFLSRLVTTRALRRRHCL